MPKDDYGDEYMTPERIERYRKAGILKGPRVEPMPFAKVELTEDEVTNISKRSMLSSGATAQHWDALPLVTQLQVKAGVVTILSVLQDMGFRVIRLKTVRDIGG